jgi:hypothetical protein
MRRGFIAALALLLATVGGASAWASTSRVDSEPNGDIALLVSLGCQGTNRDKDDDFNTCANGDTIGMLHSVANTTDAAQAVRIDGVFDGPGTEYDRTFTQTVEIPANDLINVHDELRVKNGTPLGDYTLTITAAGTETASTSAGVTVLSKNDR